MRRFIIILLGCVVCWLAPPSISAQNIVYSCWFDEDYSTLQTGTLSNNEITLDISMLAEGFHSVNVQFGTDSTAQLTRHIFYRVPTIVNTVYATTYSCWFDEDYSTLQTGQIGNGIFMLNVDSLSEGFHSVNVQYGTGLHAQIGRQIFYRIPAVADSAQATTYSCWFDEDYSTLQTGEIGNGIFMLNVDSLSDGFHSVNVQYGTGLHAQLGRHFFYKIPTAINIVHATTYSCWFDEDYSTLQTGEIGNGIFMLNVDSLSDGFHSVNVQYGTGGHAQLGRFLFYKVPTQSLPLGPITYSCWFDQADSVKQSGTLPSDGIIMLDASMLTDSNHTVFVQFGEGDHAQLSSHIFWNQVVHNIQYDESIPNGAISISSTTDTIIDGHFVFDSTVITITTTQDNNYVLQYLIVNGDTVYPPFTMVVTGNVDIQASFVKLLPDLHVTSITNSTPVANNEMTVSWTTRNDGNAPTPVGTTWPEYVYIVQNADLRLFDPDDARGLLATVQNPQALDPGESYTNTATITIPHDMVGSYFLFVLSDQVDATAIDFSENGGVAPIPYTPDTSGIPYHFFTAYVHSGGAIGPAGNVEEEEEKDNFFYKYINITAPPAADLVVTNILAPTNFYSFTDINVVATIANQGQSTTKSYGWLDALYYSHSDHYDSTAILLKTVYHDALVDAGLSVGETYQTTFACSLPAPWCGETYMYVVTDASNSEHEYAGENNNMRRSAKANVIMAPPADLVVSSVSSSNISNLDSFTVAYSIMNAGLGKTNSKEWHDRIFLSTSPELPPLQLNDNGGSYGYSYSNMPDSVDWCVLLENKGQFFCDGIAAGATVTTQKKYALPYFIDKPERLYIIVVADANNDVFEYTNEGNNVGHSSAVDATIYYPDFVLSDIAAPDVMVSGHDINLNFKLNNNGLINYLGNLDFHVYYSTDSVFDQTNATLLTYSMKHVYSSVGYRSMIILPVQFPNDIVDSNYYLYLFVNKDSVVPEYSVQNNMLRSGPHYICHMAMPDLVVCNVVFPDTLQAGEVAAITFDIVNNGETAIHNRYISTALMADDSIWCPVQMQISPYPIFELSLAVGDTLHYCQTVKVPPMIHDSVSFTLKIDASNRIQEIDEENNLLTLSRHMLSTGFDLAARSINVPSCYSTGDTVQITWTISIAKPASFSYDTNYVSTDAMGYSNTKRWYDNAQGNLWVNSLYLSYDSILSSDDIPITQNIVRTVPSDSIMFRTIRAIMPHSMSGNLYIIAKADVGEHCFEKTKENNIMCVPVTANLSAQPNLTVTAFTVDDTVTQRQGCKMYYTVTNTGEGDIAQSVWTDAIYIGSTRLATKNSFRALAAGESYSDSIEVVMPADSLGTFALIVIADDGNRIFENHLEEDNYLVRPVVVIPAPPCDLVVSSVTADAAVVMGDSMTVTWVTQNIGANSIKGQIKDAVYLSADQTYDEGDIMIGTVSYSDILPVRASRQHSLSTIVQSDLSEGNYYIIVRTNIMRAFNEVSFDNNSTSSISPTTVTMPSLYVGQEEQFTLASGDKAYYKLEVGPELAGKTLAVTLKSKVINVTNSQTGNMPRLSILASDFYASDYDIPVSVKIRGKSVVVCYKKKVVERHEDGDGYYYTYYYKYEHRSKSIYVLIDHLLYEVKVSNRVYLKIATSTNLTILNDNTAVLNGLYISHGESPTISEYNYSINCPDDTTQVLVLPSLKEGYYYFMTTAQASGGVHWGVRSNAIIFHYPSYYYNSYYYNGWGVMNRDITNDYNGINQTVQVLQEDDNSDYFYYILPRTEVTNQSMRLKADIVDFEILDVNTAMGSNTGSTTTHITGALFDTVMDFRLTSPDGIIPASNIHLVNPTEAYVTFNLTDAPEGTYNVEAELPGGIITTKENAFFVGQNLPSQLSVNIVAPSRVRVGQVTGINIDYNNDGVSDLNVVGLLVRSSSGTYLSPTPDPDHWENADIYIPIQQIGGPLTGTMAIPWSNQNQAPAIKDVIIPSSSSSNSNSSQSSSNTTNVLYGGMYPAVSGGGGRTEIYTRPNAAGKGTIDVYPVYRQLAR